MEDINKLHRCANVMELIVYVVSQIRVYYGKVNSVALQIVSICPLFNICFNDVLTK